MVDGWSAGSQRYASGLTTCVLLMHIQIYEDPAHARKTTWSNHKRAVWHAALCEMLKSIETLSKEGYTFVGADNAQRTIHPCIIILSGDYDEQYAIFCRRFCIDIFVGRS